MKKLIYSILFLAVSLSSFQSCDKDDDNNDDGGSLNNQVSIAGTLYNLNAVGSLESYGDNGNGSFDWDVTLSSTGNENVSIYFDLNTNSETGLVAGTYTYLNLREAFTYIDLEVYSSTNIDYSVQEGTVVIANIGDSTSITFDLVAQDGTVITGQWTGTFVVDIVD